MGDFAYWSLALLIMMAHATIDILKLYLQKDNTEAKWFLSDQLLHLLSILLIYFIDFRPSWDISSIIAAPTFWIYLTSIIFITSVSGIIIQELLRKWSDQIEDEDNDTDASLKNAGKYIGILERLLTFVFILIGQWEAIGFLLAAKSVFRFGDLKESKDKKLTEYILIGTLLSFGIAIGTGILVQYLLVICY